jgi:hypothetical protein
VLDPTARFEIRKSTMNLQVFKDSLERSTPPENLGLPLQALWHLARGDWDQAHTLAQAGTDEASAWVHAHLHRVEGDEENAGYWYRRARKPHARTPLIEEQEDIVSAL